jgi:hypothetical protein
MSVFILAHGAQDWNAFLQDRLDPTEIIMYVLALAFAFEGDVSD